MIDIKVFGSGSSGNGYVIDNGTDQLLLEAGIKYKDVAVGLGFDFSRVRGMLITHEHGDHSKYIKQFIDKTTIDVYMSAGTAAALELEPSYRIHLVRPFQQLHLGTWSVTGFSVQHDAAEPLGYVCDTNAGQRLLYVTDTYYVRYKFNDITHMLVEMNYAEDLATFNETHNGYNHSLHKRIYTSHFEEQASLKFIDANRSRALQQVMLIHVSATNGDPERFKAATQEITGVPVSVAGW